MERIYTSGTKTDVTYFTGFEVEKTPAYDMDTLFVVGPQPVDEIIDQAEHFGSQHIYLGANQSFHIDLMQRHPGEVELWNKIINPLLEKIKEYMKKHNLDSGAAKEAFEALEFELMVDIGYTGQYEPDELTYLNL